MNTSIQKIAILFLMLISYSAFAQDGEKTLVKAFNIDGIHEVTLDIPGDIEVKHWNNKVMRIQMTITLANGTVHMLKSLVTAGRYNLNSITKDGDYMVHAPNMAKEITIQGQPLQEKISYIVYAPERISIKLADETSTSSTNPEVDSSSL